MVLRRQNTASFTAASRRRAPAHIIQQIVAIAALPLALVALYALLDYGWTAEAGVVYCTSAHGADIGAPFEACIAEWLLAAFGVPAFVLPPLVLAGVLIYFFRLRTDDDPTPISISSFAIRSIGALALFAGLSALFEGFFNYRFGGGALGEGVIRLLQPYVSAPPMVALAVITAVTGLFVMYRLSFPRFIERSGAIVVALVGAWYHRYQQRRGQRRPYKPGKPVVVPSASSNDTSPPVVSNEVKKDGFFADIRRRLQRHEQPSAATALPPTRTRLQHLFEQPLPTPRPAPVRPPQSPPPVPAVAVAQAVKPPPVVTMPVKGLPSVTLLSDDGNDSQGYSDSEQLTMGEALVRHLRDFGIEATVAGVVGGPVITRFELALASGTKAGRVTQLAGDLARSMAIRSVRVVEVIDGKTTIGIEIPNAKPATIHLRPLLQDKAFTKATSPLTLVLGKTITGETRVVDLASMPHLLIAGTTGAGKSVAINAMLASLLYRASPAQVKLILIDPKILELSIYDGIPHLITPVVTTVDEARNALAWCVAEMDRRYRLMNTCNTRHINGFNAIVARHIADGDPLFEPEALAEDPANPQMLTPLPFIVIFIDELADLILQGKDKFETLVARLAGKARAAGIHMVIATQRPDAGIVTGIIKANIPARIAFHVPNQTNSRIVLDEGGAEHLLGKGDMLYKSSGPGGMQRIHGAFISDEEVQSVVAHWQAQGAPDYIDGITEGMTNDTGNGGDNGEVRRRQFNDELYPEVLQFLQESGRDVTISIATLQREFPIGFNRAKVLFDHAVKQGVIKANHKGQHFFSGKIPDDTTQG